MRIKVRCIPASLVMVGLLVGVTQGAQPRNTPDSLEKGKVVYERVCIFCHGVKGKGDGPSAFFQGSFSSPRPNDFTVGQYKFRSTPSGELPTDHDLFRTITNGIPGYMPPFVGLSEEDRWSVVLYLKTFNPKNYSSSYSDNSDKKVPYFRNTPGSSAIEVPPISSTPESIDHGRRIYVKFECNSCHGPNAHGDHPRFEVGDLKDSAGLPIRATDLDLTNPFSFKNGFSAPDIVRTLMTGLDGTPMPSYADAFAANKEDAWHLANYIMSLAQGPRP